ncbi:MAG: CpaF family protein [Alphaproteobacteria bacterium]|nr:CpaF family protein [Alphaproteobacteria bacterium]
MSALPYAAPAGNVDDIQVSDQYQDMKFRVFEVTLEYLDRRGVTGDTIQHAALLDEIARAISIVLGSRGLALNTPERSQLILDVVNEITGFGPLQPLLDDPGIDDVIVNGPRTIYVERKGELEPVNARFRDMDHLMNVIQRIVAPIGRRIDEANPYVDGRLPDGSRLNVVIPPVALDGPHVSIRKFKAVPFTGEDLVRNGSMTAEGLRYLSGAVRNRRNILISGGTGSGKTTLLNVLSSYVGAKERIVTIEDTAELRLQMAHVVRMETRAATMDGAREITARDLLRNALRMRPDRIILGEVRSHEAIEVLQAMGTGHDGSMATIHANGTSDALERLEMLVGLHGFSSDLRSVRRFIVSAVDIVVQTMRGAGGRRSVSSVVEITGLEGSHYMQREIYRGPEQAERKGAVP